VCFGVFAFLPPSFLPSFSSLLHPSLPFFLLLKVQMMGVDFGKVGSVLYTPLAAASRHTPSSRKLSLGGFGSPSTSTPTNAVGMARTETITSNVSAILKPLGKHALLFLSPLFPSHSPTGLKRSPISFRSLPPSLPPFLPSSQACWVPDWTCT